MADINPKYGTSDQAITITLASLADGSKRESTAIDNSTNRYIDALVGGKITTGTSPTDDQFIYVYAYGTVDSGTIYSGGASGTDAAYTGRLENLFLLGVISVSSTSDTAYEFGPFSVMEAIPGVMLPDHWGVVVRNETGAALNSTAGNHDINYQGIEAESA